MDEQGLDFSLGVVTDDHDHSQKLVELEIETISVNLLLEHPQEESNEQGPSILNQEDSSPRSLSAQVLIVERDFLIQIELSMVADLFLVVGHVRPLLRVHFEGNALISMSLFLYTMQME